MVKNISNVFLVMDSHTILHNSESLLTTLNKIYGKDKINLSVSLKDVDIPNSLNERFIKNERNVIENIA